MVSERLGEAHMRSTTSLRSFPNDAFETVPMFVWLTMALSRPFKEDRRALPLSTPLSSRRSMVWCPWLCALQEVSQAPQHFRSSGTQTICEGCFARQSNWWFPFSQAGHPQEFPKVDVEQWHMPVWVAHSTFHFCGKPIESVRMMAYVVRLSLLETIQTKLPWLTIGGDGCTQWHVSLLTPAAAPTTTWTSWLILLPPPPPKKSPFNGTQQDNEQNVPSTNQRTTAIMLSRKNKAEKTQAIYLCSLSASRTCRSTLASFFLPSERLRVEQGWSCPHRPAAGKLAVLNQWISTLPLFTESDVPSTTLC